MPASPAQLLERALDQRVTLLLKDSRRLTGRLLGIDEHLNILLGDTEETTKEQTRRLGRVVLRGSNVVSLHAPEASAPGPGRAAER
jgi:small nuclear ribonucleoprotein